MYKISLFLVMFLLCSCELMDPEIDYPGDRFSRNLSYAVATKKSAQEIHYAMEKGIVELHLHGADSYVIDHRYDGSKKYTIASLKYGNHIDNSLRYFLREGMDYKQIKGFLGIPHEKWGSPSPNMYVWNLVDGRKLAIMPSILEMPEGMKSYSLLNEAGRPERMTKMIPFGSDGSRP